ncbi:dTMP kinase [Alkaliphilus metalliredigens QYMF]|uniref:Thymidylate kinase n=1 Tax=Alkaliphilus metalliredigens (strain QYMF) TaxID=293826 RepID=A6TJF7_ALKMQ|nr:dTMP kinase [Alkaliphilus metalliredigens]ABR46325.1 dTMP kinase [Alkaliphilus metalliredigens QYMF]
MKNGLFISFEGVDGAGKSTQIHYAKDFFEERGYKVSLTREPGGTRISEIIREAILDRTHQEMTHRTEALLYAASRAQHVEEFILPALAEGRVVLCDRFVDSSMVYQGRGRGLGFDAVRNINQFATGGLEPDLTIFFNIHPQVSLGRINVKEKGDRLEQEKMAFHYTVYESYHDLAQMNSSRIKVIEANQEVEKIKSEVEKIMTNLLRRDEA